MGGRLSGLPPGPGIGSPRAQRGAGGINLGCGHLPEGANSVAAGEACTTREDKALSWKEEKCT